MAALSESYTGETKSENKKMWLGGYVGVLF